MPDLEKQIWKADMKSTYALTSTVNVLDTVRKLIQV